MEDYAVNVEFHLSGFHPAAAVRGADGRIGRELSDRREHHFEMLPHFRRNLLATEVASYEVLQRERFNILNPSILRACLPIRYTYELMRNMIRQWNSRSWSDEQFRTIGHIALVPWTVFGDQELREHVRSY
jgi:hypothetical protein